MNKPLTMADLLASQVQTAKPFGLTRGQEVEGTVIEIFKNDIILDLGTKAEGVLLKRDLPEETVKNLKTGDKVMTFVVFPENDSGQVVLGLNRITSKKGTQSSPKFDKFNSALKNNQVLTGKGIEVNRGGLIVEVNGVRGFLPSSQVSLSQASNLDELVGKELQVTVIEVDSSQNRLIFSQKTNVSEDVKSKLSKIKIGDEVEGDVAAVLQFGIFVTLEGSGLSAVEGLVHISEISWEKIEDPSALFKVGDKVKAKVISTDANTGRVNLSIKQLQKDPFVMQVKNLAPDDVVKGTVAKVSSMGVHLTLENGAEGLVPASKLEHEASYKPGDSKTFLIDYIDIPKRRVNLAPFLTSTKDLIYK